MPPPASRSCQQSSCPHVSTAQTVEAAHRLGAAYLAKPFMEEILYAAIEGALTKGYPGLLAAVDGAEQRPPGP